MGLLELPPDFFAHAWEVLLLFVIPIGGGIPAGVVLAQKYAFPWAVMAILYFVSDIVLACTFEPVLLLFLRASERVPALGRLRETLVQATQITTSRYGINPGPFALILIAFGTDPMTGRAVNRSLGHGFVTGWLLSIAGDMIFFAIIMISTLSLNSLLGDGTWTAIIVMVAMLGIPPLIGKLRRRFGWRATPHARRLMAADAVAMPWKNGGGETFEIARFPASPAIYRWRLNKARVEKDGPFSTFPGFNRWVIIIDGAGLLLNDRKLAPFEVLHFAGERNIDARLIDGPVSDLGLIYDRERTHAEMRLLNFDREPVRPPTLANGVHHFYCVDGTLLVDGKAIGPGETWQNFGDSPAKIQGPGRAVMVSIFDGAPKVN